MMLKSLGPHLGLSRPLEMFWATGALSSFLDNTPTYLVFLTTAGTLGFMNGVTTSLESYRSNFCLLFPAGCIYGS